MTKVIPDIHITFIHSPDWDWIGMYIDDQLVWNDEEQMELPAHLSEVEYLEEYIDGTEG